MIPKVSIIIKKLILIIKLDMKSCLRKDSTYDYFIVINYNTKKIHTL